MVNKQWYEEGSNWKSCYEHRCGCLAAYCPNKCKAWMWVEGKWQEQRLIWRGLSLFFVLRPNSVFVPSSIPFLSLLEPCLYNFILTLMTSIHLLVFSVYEIYTGLPILENILYLILQCFSAPISFSPLSVISLINTHIASPFLPWLFHFSAAPSFHRCSSDTTVTRVIKDHPINHLWASVQSASLTQSIWLSWPSTP